MSHSRTQREPDGSVTEWTSPDGVMWNMVSQTYPESEWTTCGTERFNLSASELRTLKQACKAFNLQWRAQAARPTVARKLIDQFKYKGVS